MQWDSDVRGSNWRVETQRGEPLDKLPYQPIAVVIY